MYMMLLYNHFYQHTLAFPTCSQQRVALEGLDGAVLAVPVPPQQSLWYLWGQNGWWFHIWFIYGSYMDNLWIIYG